MPKRQINEITVKSPKVPQPLTFALVADLHNGSYDDVLPTLKTVDAILIGGDLVKRYDDRYDNALRFLQDAPQCAPTFYARGNHERKLPSHDLYWAQVLKSDVTILDNTWLNWRGIVLGGMTSAWNGEEDNTVVKQMAQQPGFKLLVCHHPEYFEPYVQPYDIDLTLAGHAHGGQVRLFGQGLFAPGQGVLPKLTSGWYFDNRLLVSRGMTNASKYAPRLFNPCELILIHLIPE